MIKIENLNISFGSGSEKIYAVKDVNLHVQKGECFGVVGESGSGKTTLLKAIIGLLCNWQGRLLIKDEPQGFNRKRDFYKKIQLVFQDPYASLHPRHTVNRILSDPFKIHAMKGFDREVDKILHAVGLSRRFRYRFAHQLSGGQRQRVAIARAIVLKPEILLLDEPTSALDVSVQAEILNLLNRIKKAYNLTYVLVSHNLAVISHMCDRLVVMNRGKIVETMSCAELRAQKAKHPYTQQLLKASLGYDSETAAAMADFDCF